MEHAEKSGGEEPSQWVVLKSPSLVLIQLLTAWWQKRKRSASERVTDGSQTSVPEEVAKELGIEIEYTDLSWAQRFNQQPLYLTVASCTTAVFRLDSRPITELSVCCFRSLRSVVDSQSTHGDAK
jgi:hypothetical protein